MGACAFHCGEDIRTDWTVGIPNGDRDLQYGLKGLADIKALGLTANKDRHRLEVVRGFACRLGRSDARAIRRSFGCSSDLPAPNWASSSSIRAVTFALTPSASSFASGEAAAAIICSVAVNSASALSFKASVLRTDTIASADSREAVMATSLD
jgi:hypothetical protein